jgi:hypothetical protein
MSNFETRTRIGSITDSQNAKEDSFCTENAQSILEFKPAGQRISESAQNFEPIRLSVDQERP